MREIEQEVLNLQFRRNALMDELDVEFDSYARKGIVEEIAQIDDRLDQITRGDYA